MINLQQHRQGPQSDPRPTPSLAPDVGRGGGVARRDERGWGCSLCQAPPSGNYNMSRSQMNHANGYLHIYRPAAAGRGDREGTSVTKPLLLNRNIYTRQNLLGFQTNNYSYSSIDNNNY